MDPQPIYRASADNVPPYHPTLPYVPTFSPQVRTVTYVACLFVAVLTALVCSLLVVFEVIDVVTGSAITAAVCTACAAIAGGMGVAYRPTRPSIHDDGTPNLDYVARHRA